MRTARGGRIPDFIRGCGPTALGGRLRRLSESIDEDARRCYAELGIEFEQRWVGIAEQLTLHETMSVSELAAALGVRHASVSQSRRSMEAAKLIESHADPDDARSRRLSLTGKGREIVSRLAPLWTLLNEASAEIDREAGQVVASLDRLDQVLGKRSLFERVKRRLAAAGGRRRARAG